MTVSLVITFHCPDGIDGHRTLGDKPGLAGKRDMSEEDFRSGLSLLHRKKGPSPACNSQKIQYLLCCTTP